MCIRDRSHPALNLWMFDTQGKGCAGNQDSFGCIQNDQISWYEQKSAEIKQKHGDSSDTTHVAFMHIPLEEYMYMWNEKPVYGNKGEDVACPQVNTGFMSAVLNQKNIKAVFAGHDHNNDFGGFYEGVELVYGRKTGFGGYGPDDFNNGARVLKFKEVKDPKTNKIHVESDHFIVDSEGKTIQKQSASIRNNLKQEVCKFPSSTKTFSLGGLSEVGDSSKIALIIIFIIAGAIFWYFYRRRQNKHGQEGLKLIEIRRINKKPENQLQSNQNNQHQIDLSLIHI
eukprot:TRINITY_DN10515_c0_g1_i15.p1 TRINITY_DN10515_c0_g1~~TRINITY_DN10515_c0_g1_i15.p1  ORF type:complete len:283 (-),score=49.51 TRINITY_DN10515_c0_g1_i15:4-852(-)